MSSNTPVWFAETPPRPSLAGGVDTDLCVVGLGGSGLAAIRAGVAAGMRVVGVDAGRVASGAAGRNGGFLLAGPAWFHHDARERVGVDVAARMYRATLDELDRMEGEPSVRRCGSLRIAADADEHADIERHALALAEDEFPVEQYRGAEGEGIVVPDDAVFDPFAHCAARAAALERDGAALYERTRAVGVESGVVHCETGVVRAARIVVAVDGGLGALVPALRERVTTWRLQMLATEPVTERITSRAVYARYGYDYWQQLPDGRIALGGGRDVGGDDEREAPLGVTDVVQAHLERVLREIIGTRATVQRRWSGRVAYTADGMPICEDVADGVTAIGAYCGTGNIIGRMLGREVVERWAGREVPYVSALREARDARRVAHG